MGFEAGKILRDARAVLADAHADTGITHHPGADHRAKAIEHRQGRIGLNDAGMGGIAVIAGGLRGPALLDDGERGALAREDRLAD